MRRLEVLAPSGKGREILDIARKYGGVNLSQVRSDTPDGPRDLSIIYLPNDRLEGFMGEADKIPDLRLTLQPSGVIPLYPPQRNIAPKAVEVTRLSPIEVYLSGLQSVGSWTSFLGYAAAAGIIVWVGLFTDTVYLLIAAMLIAPFAGPAMNAAIATARGDGRLLWQSLIRYCVSILLSIAIAVAMSIVFDQQMATNLMVSVSELSSTYLLLPVVAGAAGALNLTQSRHSSLVSGAAVGLLVAVSLAPPAGLVGMAAIIGRWDLVDNGIFALLLTMLGINLGGTIVLRLFGVTYRGARYTRGNRWIFLLMAGLTVLSIVGLLAWQFHNPPHLQKSTQEQRASALISDVVEQSGLAYFLQANVRFAPSGTPENNLLLADVYVKKADGVTLPSDEIKQRLARSINERLISEKFNVIPLADVTVVEGPGHQQA